jgi:hypothetical protein
MRLALTTTAPHVQGPVCRLARLFRSHCGQAHSSVRISRPHCQLLRKRAHDLVREKCRECSLLWTVPGAQGGGPAPARGDRAGRQTSTGTGENQVIGSGQGLARARWPGAARTGDHEPRLHDSAVAGNRGRIWRTKPGIFLLLVGWLIARKISKRLERSRPRPEIPSLTWAFTRAGDGNRTRTISLGIGPIIAGQAADQADQQARSSRD